MDPDDPESNVPDPAARQDSRFVGVKRPWYNFLRKKPSLEPEVIELAPPGDGDEPSTSSHVNANSRRGSRESRDDQSSLVFDTHIAVLYDRYLNFKESMSNKLKEKIMAFMRDDLENAQNDQDLDIEGGLAPRQAESTYDGLILILTIFLGFLFRFPFMWVIGSILFLVYGNFKKKIIKWGVVNILLTVLSIVYAVQIWQFNDPTVFSIKAGHRTVLFSRHPPVRGIPGVLMMDGKDALALTFEGRKDLTWSIVSNEEKQVKEGRFSDELLVNHKLVPDKVHMIRLDQEITVEGLVQMTVKFRTKHPREPPKISRPHSHYYPLHHKPRHEPYDVSFECHPAEAIEDWKPEAKHEEEKEHKTQEKEKDQDKEKEPDKDKEKNKGEKVEKAKTEDKQKDKENKVDDKEKNELKKEEKNEKGEYKEKPKQEDKPSEKKDNEKKNYEKKEHKPQDQKEKNKNKGNAKQEEEPKVGKGLYPMTTDDEKDEKGKGKGSKEEDEHLPVAVAGSEDKEKQSEQEMAEIIQHGLSELQAIIMNVDHKNDKKYIGVNAIASDEDITRLFSLRRLSRCKLVHLPKKGTDVVSVTIKRLQ